MNLNIIETIDLWTEAKDNHQECFDGAFSDGFNGDTIPFDSFKIVKNCNCFIHTFPKNMKINNKHNAVVFYKDGVPVRLMVLNKNTNVEECISNALKQPFKGGLLINLYNEYGITSTTVDMKEEPIEKEGITKEMDVGSSDRYSLLKSMLEGSYTEEESSVGVDKETLYPKERMIKYTLATDEELFDIRHTYSFTNKEGDRIIPLQDKGFKKH